MWVKLSPVGIILVFKFWYRSVFRLGIEGKIDFPRDYLGTSLPLECDPLSAGEEIGCKNQEHLPVKKSQSNTQSI